jgi:two-component system KDP operon response regulator KdpE
VRVGGEAVALTPREYEVLAYLARNAGKVLTHRQNLQAVWGEQYGDEAEYLWTYAKRIRRKIEPDRDRPRYLMTEPGVGYFFPAPD